MTTRKHVAAVLLMLVGVSVALAAGAGSSGGGTGPNRAAAVASSSSPSSTGSRQSSGGSQGQSTSPASGFLSNMASLLPSIASNFLPMLMLFGLGALLVPVLGLGLLLREGRRRSFGNVFNSSALVDGLSDVMERVLKALDNADKKY